MEPPSCWGRKARPPLTASKPVKKELSLPNGSSGLKTA
jgi:hypothetical protein